MSEETRPSVENAAVPFNRYSKLLAALKKAPVEECDQPPASDGERSQTPDINHCGKSLSAPFQSSPNFGRESSPTPDVSIEKSPSDNCSASGSDRQDPSPAVYEIIWDHTMSDGSEEEDDEEEEEDEGEEEDFHRVDGEMYDKWYGSSSVCYGQTDEDNCKFCEFSQRFEDDDNSYEVDEVTSKLKKLPHSDKSPYEPGKMLYTRSHDIDEDEDRNKIYDKWICDVETWERQRLLWLDERGKIEGFDSSCDKDRTFLVKVDSAASKLLSKTGTLKRHESFSDSALFNTNDDHSFSQSEEDVSGVSECLTVDNPKERCEILYNDSSTNLVRYSEEPMESEDKPLTLPLDLTSVYEFTDRNLWRKYHNCFKEGKFNNNQ